MVLYENNYHKMLTLQLAGWIMNYLCSDALLVQPRGHGNVQTCALSLSLGQLLKLALFRWFYLRWIINNRYFDKEISCLVISISCLNNNGTVIIRHTD